MDKRLAVVVAVAVLTSALSTAMHYPPLRVGEKLRDFGLQYSDIVYGVFLDRFSPHLLQTPSAIERKWIDSQKYMELMSGRPVCPAPYIDYFFEYPPLVGVIWYATSCAAIRAAFGSGVEPMSVGKAVEEASNINYLLQSIVLSGAYIATAAMVYALCVELGIDWRRAVLLSILPSTIMYTAYNWDALSAMLIIASLLCFARSRYGASGVLAGLSIATKVVTYTVAIAMLYELVQQSRREGLKKLSAFAAGLALGCGIPMLALALVAPRGLGSILAHYSSWYCENCIYMLLPGGLSTNIAHAAYMTAAPVAMLLALSVSMEKRENLARVPFLAICVSTLFSYIFAPQLWLEISPLAVLALNSSELRVFIVGDALNAGVMAAFFKDRELRELVSRIVPGIQVKFDPWSLSSPVQWIAMARNVVLLILWLSCLFRALKSSFSN